MWNESRVRRREKSAAVEKQVTSTQHRPPQATAEQIRLAHLVVDQKDDDAQLSKNISKIMEVTGVSEENALLALYDSNDDPSRAIELLLEKETMGGDGGWEMAGRRKHRGGSSVTRGNDGYDEEVKEQNADKAKFERIDTVAKGRGRKVTGRDFDRTKTRQDNDKENVQSGKERYGGRGRSRSGQGRGRGRGAPRHYKNSVLAGKSIENSVSFDSNKDSLQGPVDMWKGPDVDCWDIEVGTWSSKDVQKKQDTPRNSNTITENWGTESWTDDLSESRVFQAQNRVPAESVSASDGDSVILKSNPLSGTIPQTGERIDLRDLFKKSDLQTNLGSASTFGSHINHQPSELLSPHKGADHIQEFQQHGQVNPRFHETSTSPVTSRLFTDYEQPQRNTQPKSESLFETGDTTQMLDSSYPQLNGNATLHDQAKDASSFLKSFSGLTSSTAQDPQSSILGRLTNQRPELTPYSQLRISMGDDQTVLRRVPANSSQSQSPMTNMGSIQNTRDEEHLSFGSPLPPQVSQLGRHQRKKAPSMTSKIPASAVEMPGDKGYNTHFSLQFGVDDPTSATDPSSVPYDYGTGTGVPHSVPSRMIIHQSELFMNGNGQKPLNTLQSPGNAESLFSQTSQRTRSKSDLQMEECGHVAGDHPVNAPPGLNIPTSSSSALSSLSPTETTNSQHGPSFLPHSMADDRNGGRPHDPSYHKASSSKPGYPEEVTMYYASSTSSHPKHSQNMQHGSNSSGFSENLPPSSMSHNKSMQGSGSEADNGPVLESVSASHSPNISSLAAGLGQVSIQQSLTGKNHHRGVDETASHSISQSSVSSSYSPATSTPENQTSQSLNLAPNNRQTGYDAVHNSSLSSSYGSTAAQAPAPGAIVDTAGKQTSTYKMSGGPTVTSTALGGFATAKIPQVISNKGNGNIPSGVTPPIQYGIPMAGLMPYAPDMSYGYDQLLLAQSRVVNPLNFYDMHFHNNTQTAPVEGQDSSAPISQALAGRGKYNRGDTASPTQTQMTLSGSVGAELTHHNNSVPLQALQPKASQSSGHHTGQQQQQYVGAMPAYANYSSLATPYYSLGMANAAGFQYPATMFAAAMHQAPKHAVNTTDGYQQQTARFNHTSAAITSSSGMSDLSRPNYAKTHPTVMDKQQGYHQHTNTPPPFNLQALTAAVAAGGGAATGSGAPGLGPYAAQPYMALLQPHHASQQQTMHLLQHQHQDAANSHSVGSQRNLGSNSLVKPGNKHGGYGSTTSSYWGS